MSRGKNSKGGEGSIKRRKKWRRIKKAFKNCCLYCGVQRQSKKSLDPLKCLTLDRFIPLSKGGRSYFWNIIPACKQCNDVKQSLSFDEFIGLRGLSRKAIQSRWIEAIVQLLPSYFKKRDHGYWHPKRKQWFDGAEEEFASVLEGLKK